MAWTAAQKRKLSEAMQKAWKARKAGGVGAKKSSAKAGTGKSSGGAFKCAKCGRRFIMAAHLGRHMTTMHGARKSATARPFKNKAASRRVNQLAGATIQVANNEFTAMAADELITLRQRVDVELINRMLYGVA